MSRTIRRSDTPILPAMHVLDEIAPSLTDYPEIIASPAAVAHDVRAREILTDLTERKRRARRVLRAGIDELQGEEISRLLVVGHSAKPKTLRCECSCGAVLDVALTDLANGVVTRCIACEVTYRHRYGKAPE